MDRTLILLLGCVSTGPYQYNPNNPLELQPPAIGTMYTDVGPWGMEQEYMMTARGLRRFEIMQNGEVLRVHPCGRYTRRTREWQPGPAPKPIY